MTTNPSQHRSHPDKKKAFPLLRLALGAALAAGAGYYFTHKEEVNKEARKKIDRLAELFEEKRPEMEKRVREVWGEVSKEAVAKYVDLRGHLLHELEEENLRKRGKMIREQYEKVVESVIRRARKSDLLTPETEEKLKEIFKMDWVQVKEMLMELMAKGVEKTAKAVRKMQVSNKAKTVKKSVKKAGKTAAKKASSRKSGHK